MFAALLLFGSETGGAGAWIAALVGSLVSLVVALPMRRGLLRLPRPTEAQLAVLVRSLAYANPLYVPWEPTLDLHLLTDDKLGHAWRCSGVAVSSSTDKRDLMCAIDQRQRYLDELERRQPGLLGAWLASRLDAADDVLAVGTASRLEPHSIDWDELIREESP